MPCRLRRWWWFWSASPTTTIWARSSATPPPSAPMRCLWTRHAAIRCTARRSAFRSAPRSRCPSPPSPTTRRLHGGARATAVRAICPLARVERTDIGEAQRPERLALYPRHRGRGPARRCFPACNGPISHGARFRQPERRGGVGNRTASLFDGEDLRRPAPSAFCSARTRSARLTSAAGFCPTVSAGAAERLGDRQIGPLELGRQVDDFGGQFVHLLAQHPRWRCRSSIPSSDLMRSSAARSAFSLVLARQQPSASLLARSRSLILAIVFSRSWLHCLGVQARHLGLQSAYFRLVLRLADQRCQPGRH